MSESQVTDDTAVPKSRVNKEQLPEGITSSGRVNTTDYTE
jgi:hypothetical protein